MDDDTEAVDCVKAWMVMDKEKMPYAQQGTGHLSAVQEREGETWRRRIYESAGERSGYARCGPLLAWKLLTRTEFDSCVGKTLKL